MRIVAVFLAVSTLMLTSAPAGALNSVPPATPSLASLASGSGVRVVRLLDRAEQVIGTVNRDGTLNLAGSVTQADIATVRVLRATPTGAVTVLDYPASRFLAALAQARTSSRPTPGAAPAPTLTPTAVRSAGNDRDDQPKNRGKKTKGKKGNPGQGKAKGRGR